MPIDPNAVGTEGEPSRRTWTSKDSILYALGVGAGANDPVGHELEFTTENSEGVTQRALPTMAVVLGGGSTTVLAQIGDFNWAGLLHGGQSVTCHRELPPEGELQAVGRIEAIWDKQKSAVVEIESAATLVDDGDPLFTVKSTVVLRGEGGWGGDRGPSAAATAPPERAPDHAVTYTTREDQPLLYRLSGDRNPLHSDPKFAAKAGFDRPILHGLCTYGFAGRALLHTLCDSDPARFGSMDGRFSSPVMPGEDLTTNMWELDDGWAFAVTGSDGRTVFDGGRFTLRA